MAFSTLKGVIDVDHSGVSDGINEAEGDLDSLAGRAQNTGRSMQRAGAVMTAGITAPLTAMGAMSARAAASFDQNMQSSIAVMGDVDDAMRENLEETAREVARTTTVSAEEAADAYYYLASAGLDAAQAMEAMPQVAEFAEAGNMRMAEATDVATNVMSAYGYEAEEMTEVTDRMTATVSNHNQTMEGMSTALSRVAPTAAGLGIELGELNAAIGALGDVGIQGERAGTALNTVISQMSDETSPAVQQMEEMGVSVRNAEGEMLPLVEIIRQFKEAGADAGDMAQVFGTRGGPAMAALLEQGSDSLEDSTQNINEMEGATEEMAETQRETLNAELQMARDNITDVGIAIGADLLPMLSTLTAHVASAAEWFQGLSDRQRHVILAAGGLLAALGPVVGLLGTIGVVAPAVAGGIATLAAAKTALAGVITGGLVPASVAGSGGLLGLAAAAVTAQVALGPITVPIWLIIGALGVLVAAIGAVAYAFHSNLFGIRDTTMAVVDPVTNSIDWLIEKLFGISDATDQVADAFGDFVDWIITQVNRIPGVDIGGEGLGFSSDTDADTEGLGEDVGGLEDGDPGEFMGETDFEMEGEQAGQDFGSGFQEGVVESLEPEDVTEHLDNEIEDVEDQLSELRQGGVALEDQEEAAELERALRDLEGQREDVDDAESITDIDSAFIADAAEADLQAQQEEEQAISEVYAELEGRGVEASQADTTGLETGQDTSVSSEDVDALLADDGAGEGQQGDQEIISRLDQLIERVEQLPESLEGLRLRMALQLLDDRELRQFIRDEASEVIVEGGRA